MTFRELDTDEVRQIFSRFNGAIAPVTETPGTPGTPFPVLDPAPAAGLVAEMQDVAREHGVRLALLWPGRDHDSFDPGRVNAHLEKTAPATWRVTRFDIG